MECVQVEHSLQWVCRWFIHLAGAWSSGSIPGNHSCFQYWCHRFSSDRRSGIDRRQNVTGPGSFNQERFIQPQRNNTAAEHASGDIFIPSLWESGYHDRVWCQRMGLRIQCRSAFPGLWEIETGCIISIQDNDRSFRRCPCHSFLPGQQAYGEYRRYGWSRQTAFQRRSLYRQSWSWCGMGGALGVRVWIVLPGKWEMDDRGGFCLYHVVGIWGYWVWCYQYHRTDRLRVHQRLSKPCRFHRRVGWCLQDFRRCRGTSAWKI